MADVIYISRAELTEKFAGKHVIVVEENGETLGIIARRNPAKAYFEAKKKFPDKKIHGLFVHEPGLIAYKID